MKRIPHILLLATLLFHNTSNEIFAQQSSSKYPPTDRWMVSCMTDRSGFEHFLLLPNGKVSSFFAGGQPAPVEGLTDIISLAAGSQHVLALKKDGTIWGWGVNRLFQLGNKASEKIQVVEVPVKVDGISNAIGISAMNNSSYALLADGTVMAWGDADQGMAGDGKTLELGNHSEPRRSPVKVQNINNAVSISGAMALLATGEVMAWGYGANGKLGNGSNQPSNIPVKVKGIEHAIAISSSIENSLALLSNGEVWAWGVNGKGELGNGAKAVTIMDYSSEPVHVVNIKSAITISAHFTCLALLSDGTVMGWGWGDIAGLGSKKGPVNSTPIKIPLTGKYIAIKAESASGFAMMADGTIMGWGREMTTTGAYHQVYSPVKITQVDLHAVASSR